MAVPKIAMKANYKVNFRDSRLVPYTDNIDSSQTYVGQYTDKVTSSLRRMGIRCTVPSGTECLCLIL